jgi:two-component sensor histidine kinase
MQLRDTIADELFHYGVQEGVSAILSGPSVELEPRAGQVLALAIHELAINAIQHGELANGGRVEVKWQIDTQPSPVLTIVWYEPSATAVQPPKQEGFGTEVLTRMLNYELGAQASFSVEHDGVRWIIAIPISERVASFVGG